MPQQSLADLAKAPIVGYNNKDWNAVRASATPTLVYDEVATHRAVKGIDEVLDIWRGWAAAFPDSVASFDTVATTGDTVILEVTWRGTHTGKLRTPTGEVAGTGKKIDLRACQVVTVANDKVESIRQYFDLMTLMQQIGVVSAV